MLSYLADTQCLIFSEEVSDTYWQTCSGLVPQGLLGRLLRRLFSFFFWLQYSLTSTFPIPIFSKATLLCPSFLNIWEAWLEVSPQSKPLSICLSLSSSSLSEASGSHFPLDALVSTFTLLCLCIYYVCLKPWAPNWFLHPSWCKVTSKGNLKRARQIEKGLSKFQALPSLCILGDVHMSDHFEGKYS